MHKTCLFLYTPDKNYDPMKDAEIQLMDYSEQCCDENNWWELIGIVRPDGTCHVKDDWQERFDTEYQKQHATSLAQVLIDDLRVCALRGLLEEFEIKYSAEDDYAYLHELFNIQAPTILSQIYSGSEMPDYRRRELVNLYEYYNRSVIYPFSQYWTSPYEYSYFDLRPDRFDAYRNIILPGKDEISLFDVHC